MTDEAREAVASAIKLMTEAASTRVRSPINEQRRHACSDVQSGADFMNVAAQNQITPRVLLAWIAHEQSKWINDPTVGQEPGPSMDYAGDWPSETEELALYAQRDIDPSRFDERSLREKYEAFLSARRNVSR